MREATFIIPPRSVTASETACKSQLTVGDAAIDWPPIIIRHFSGTGDQLVLPEKANQEVGLEASVSQTLVFPETLCVKQLDFSVHCVAATVNAALEQSLVSCAAGGSLM